MPTLEIKLPQIEGAELKHVTTDLEKGYIVAEYGEKKQEFKKGDIVASSSFILPHMGVYNNGILANCYYSRLNQIARIFGRVDIGCGLIDQYRFATPCEQQLLFDALAKEGKKWNPDTLEIEEIEQRILVPESIGIYTVNQPVNKYRYGDGLLIGFNGDKQMLGVDTINGIYVVTQKDNLIKVQCYLQPCKKEDIKAGDTWFGSDVLSNFDSLCYYNKALLNNKHAYIINGMDVYVNGDADWKYYYKLIPVE